MSSGIIPVSALARYLRDLVETDDIAQDLWVEGEISSFTVAASGHAYLTIKDAMSAIDGMMWKQTFARQSFRPRVGDKVIVHGGATVYEKTTRLQLRADVIHPAGAGLLQAQLELLRQKLEAEGLFDPERKRSLPAFPRRIGVVTSPTGAVWHDIQRVIERRFPLVELILSPAQVEGDRAPESVVKAIARLAGQDIDVMIVARGGGSAEALWAFNDERIVRAIFASPVPVVSAIGHETDTSLSDFVADAAAPTPSVAAELVVPDRAVLLDDLRATRIWLASTASSAVRSRSQRVADLHHRLLLRSPIALVSSMRSQVNEARLRASTAIRLDMERRSHRFERERSRLIALDPFAVLGRGYAWITERQSGQVVHSAASLQPGAEIVATFVDGSVQATIDASS